MMSSRFLALLFAIIGIVSSSRLDFLYVPSSVHLDASSTSLLASDVVPIARQLIGLTAATPPSWTGYGDLLNRPKALAMIVIDSQLPLTNAIASYSLSGSSDDVDMESLNQELHAVFGDSLQSIDTSALPSAIAGRVVEDALIKTKMQPLRQELEDIHRLADSLMSGGARLASSASPDFYEIRVQGLAIANQFSNHELEIAEKDLENALDKLTKALRVAYGDQVVVAMASFDATTITDTHEIVKRQADPTSVNNTLMKLRKDYNVYQFTSSDYPAIFAIFAGLSILLVLAVLVIAVGMWNMDPGKDSIIYRMTTTRMKKD